MVAPITLSRPTRVFARLTYTGEDKSAPAVCCDLSRVASIVPANPLPKNLVADSTSQSIRGMDLSTALEQKIVSAHSTMAALVHKEDYALVASAAAEANSDIAGSESGVVVSVAGVGQSNISERSNNSASSKARAEKRASTDNDNGPAKRRKMSTNQSSLLAENENLKLQNELLKRQLLTFKMVFQREENYQLAMQRVKALQNRVLLPAAAASQ